MDFTYLDIISEMLLTRILTIAFFVLMVTTKMIMTELICSLLLSVLLTALGYGNVSRQDASN